MPGTDTVLESSLLQIYKLLYINNMQYIQTVKSNVQQIRVRYTFKQKTSQLFKSKSLHCQHCVRKIYTSSH